MTAVTKAKQNEKGEIKMEDTKVVSNNTLTREIVFKDYRNLGINKEETLVINKRTDSQHLGELIIVIGGNNTGKSNVLDGILALKNGIDKDRDEPDFKYLDNNPEIKLVIKNCSKHWAYTVGAETKIVCENGKKIQGVKTPEPIEYKMSQELQQVFSRYGQTNIMNSMNKLEPINDQNYNNTVNWINNTYGYNNVKSQQVVSEVDSYRTALKDYNDQLKESKNYQKVVDEYNQKVSDIIGCPLVPNIVGYKEVQINQNELVTSIKNLSKSVFFQKIFDLLGINAEEITTCVERVNANKIGAGATRKLESELNTKLEKFTKQFNKMYTFDNNQYKFNFLLDTEKLSFAITYGKDIPLNIDKQSTGFRWFFNFYVNLLNDKKLGNGDIVIMDEPATNLHVRGVVELREFLKEYAKKTGITLILSTHSPFFVDADFLDELRIIKRDDENATICNDFSFDKEETRDTLFDVLSSLTVGRHVLLNPNDPLIFVEGITDYNYLVAFKRYISSKDKNEFNMNFLPVNGLKDKNLIDKLCSIVKNPMLLVDNDEAGTITEIKNKKSGSKINVTTLREVDEKIKTIEDMFVGKDKEYVKEKYNAHSRHFKNNFEEIAKNLSNETIKNFTCLFAICVMS